MAMEAWAHHGAVHKGSQALWENSGRKEFAETTTSTSEDAGDRLPS